MAIFRSTVEHAVEKRANVIFTFHKQAHCNGLHSRLYASSNLDFALKSGIDSDEGTV